jgi:hypothetical protein
MRLTCKRERSKKLSQPPRKSSNVAREHHFLCLVTCSDVTRGGTALAAVATRSLTAQSTVA